jgi:hypothetical protein
MANTIVIFIVVGLTSLFNNGPSTPDNYIYNGSNTDRGKT